MSNAPASVQTPSPISTMLGHLLGEMLVGTIEDATNKK